MIAIAIGLFVLFLSFVGFGFLYTLKANNPSGKKLLINMYFIVVVPAIILGTICLHLFLKASSKG